MKKAIAMRCTKEQFGKIESKINVSCISDFDSCNFLTNNWCESGKVSNIREEYLKEHDHNYKVYETWNENIFLDACGIETEQAYSLTKEQIRSLTDPQVKEWFPEVFKTVVDEIKSKPY